VGFDVLLIIRGIGSDFYNLYKLHSFSFYSFIDLQYIILIIFLILSFVFPYSDLVIVANRFKIPDPSTVSKMTI